MELQALRVRPCEKGDLAAMRRICEETSSIPCRTDAERRFLNLVFCDPYVQTQTAHCFVAVNGQDDPLGYILCAPDTKAFLRVFRRDYLPQIDRLGAHFALQGRAAQLIHVLLGGTFPAHLHIDLSEAARHRGTGTALMNALKAHLSAMGIHTLALSCSAQNKNAVRFYRRNGFFSVAKLFGAEIMICHF